MLFRGSEYYSQADEVFQHLNEMEVYYLQSYRKSLTGNDIWNLIFLFKRIFKSVSDLIYIHLYISNIYTYITMFWNFWTWIGGRSSRGLSPLVKYFLKIYYFNGFFVIFLISANSQLYRAFKYIFLFRIVLHLWQNEV